MGDDERLMRDLGDALRAGRRQPPPDRVAALRAQVTRQFHMTPDEDPSVTLPRGRGAAWKPTAVGSGRWRWLVTAAVAAAAGVALLVLMLRPAPGTVEFDGRIASDDGDVAAAVSVRALPFGRVVRLSSDDLPVLPSGEYYELWFVGPDDRPGNPDRISAGTWHPDEQGESDVRFHAAVDPSQYPVISVTAEPGDGDPRATGPQVLRSEPITGP